MQRAAQGAEYLSISQIFGLGTSRPPSSSSQVVEAEVPARSPPSPTSLMPMRSLRASSSIKYDIVCEIVASFSTKLDGLIITDYTENPDFPVTSNPHSPPGRYCMTIKFDPTPYTYITKNCVVGDIIQLQDITVSFYENRDRQSNLVAAASNDSRVKKLSKLDSLAQRLCLRKQRLEKEMGGFEVKNRRDSSRAAASIPDLEELRAKSPRERAYSMSLESAASSRKRASSVTSDSTRASEKSVSRRRSDVTDAPSSVSSSPEYISEAEQVKEEGRQSSVESDGESFTSLLFFSFFFCNILY